MTCSCATPATLDPRQHVRLCPSCTARALAEAAEITRVIPVESIREIVRTDPARVYKRERSEP